MSKHFVRVLCDVHCNWEGLPPTYRLYINDELFTERTWIWTNEYLEECIQLEAEPGKYEISYELVPPHLAELTIENVRVDEGPAKIKNQKIIKIRDA